MMKDKGIPLNWIIATLGQIAEWSSGGTPKKGISSYYGGAIPFIKTGDLNHGVITEVKEYLTEEGIKNSSAKIFPTGSVCIAMYGATIGKTGVFGIDAATNQACAVAKTYLNMEKFLHYYLKSQKQNFIGKGKGGAQPNISQTIIKKHPIPLPPRPEQDRIVAKVDILMAQVESMQKSLARIPQLLKDFRQQVLTQAVMGKLTEEWREKSKLCNSYDHKQSEYQLKDISLSITDGDHQAPPKVEQGIPFLVISNVSKGFFDFDGVTRFVPFEYFENLKDSRIPKKGDILYTVTGSFGIPLLVNFNKDFCFQRHIAIIRPNNNIVLSEYLLIHLQSQRAKRQAENVAKGTAQLTVPLGGLRKFRFGIHPLNEQKEIVRGVASLFSKADAIETQYQSLKSKIDTLPQAILHKAFKGDLVPQLQDDGDARELFREIEGLKTKKITAK